VKIGLASGPRHHSDRAIRAVRVSSIFIILYLKGEG
jgi:hypothetical protein